MLINEISIKECGGNLRPRVVKVNKGITIIPTQDPESMVYSLANTLHYLPGMSKDQIPVIVRLDHLDEIECLSEINMVSGCKAALNCKVFEYKNMSYSKRLLCYKQCDDYYGRKNFDSITGGLGHYKVFRAYLCSFIRDYKPGVLSKEKGIEINIKDNGEFYIKKGDNTKGPMSSQERFMFEYYCFIELNRFWEGFAERCSLDVPRLPLLVSGITSNDFYFDSMIDYIKKSKTDGQIIVFVENVE